MNNKIERYRWEDAIIEAGALNAISATGVNFALRISRQINWTPRKNKPLGLNWKNALAYDSVGLSESSGKRGKKNLMENGFIEIKNGNIVPTMPDNVEVLHSEYSKHLDDLKAKHLHQEVTGQKEPSENQKEPQAGQIGPSRGQIDPSTGQKYPPFTEDAFSEDQLTEDSLTEDQYLAASPRDNPKDESSDGQPSLCPEGNEVAGGARNDSSPYPENEDTGLPINSEEESARGQIDLLTRPEDDGEWISTRKMTNEQLSAHIAELEAKDVSSLRGTPLLAHRSLIKSAKSEQAKREADDDDFWL